jgi:hypothetical protein
MVMADSFGESAAEALFYRLPMQRDGTSRCTTERDCPMEWLNVMQTLRTGPISDLPR